ncbi:MAG: hypothetical protein AB7F85_08310 [Hyphomonadaceae bacterium]
MNWRYPLWNTEGASWPIVLAALTSAMSVLCLASALSGLRNTGVRTFGVCFAASLLIALTAEHVYWLFRGQSDHSQLDRQLDGPLWALPPLAAALVVGVRRRIPIARSQGPPFMAISLTLSSLMIVAALRQREVSGRYDLWDSALFAALAVSVGVTLSLLVLKWSAARGHRNRA